MRRLLLSIGIVLAGVAVAAASYGLRGGSPEAAAFVPKVARITCEPDQALLDAPSVRARADGVHFAVANLSRALFLEVRSADGSAERLPLTPGLLEESTLTIAPGPVSVECLSGRETGRSRPPTTLEIVDPDGLWVSPKLTCEETVTIDYTVSLADEEPAETFHRSIPGLTAADELVKPGYPQTLWHGDLLIVVREGETVARVTRAQSEGLWDVSVDACPGTGLTDA